MTRAGRTRWALSFADLCLLLLGFFVLLQANQAQRDAALAGIGAYFGAIAAPAQADLPAAALFEPGEALLSAGGRARIAAAARRFAANGHAVQIQSIGLDAGTRRFDAWDLAAARLGAAARALTEAGIPADRLRIAGLAEQADGPASAGQTIRIVERPLASR